MEDHEKQPSQEGIDSGSQEPFLLDTDTSNVSIGAVLSQVHNGNKQVTSK